MSDKKDSAKLVSSTAKVTETLNQSSASASRTASDGDGNFSSVTDSAENEFAADLGPVGFQLRWWWPLQRKRSDELEQSWKCSIL